MSQPSLFDRAGKILSGQWPPPDDLIIPVDSIFIILKFMTADTPFSVTLYVDKDTHVVYPMRDTPKEWNDVDRILSQAEKVDREKHIPETSLRHGNWAISMDIS
jgi:hypothetical protein